ncbi:hypothetical protein AVEN_262010-1 [Araneus ventricosus]|uniref:Uncharacterized protein n=1 Tax=Araneus ventricosus TaxID=182803 RepID=A0A4Y1ZRD4_ARAVE|nr:hypothetical protein AVEN_196857-1 [Araneus ventricosus]GBL64303.1 hypothetical protein AVEN_124622-1 [Araneus ventricosus]GBL64327.1 hypothetical protein AVEN_156741-1 [Araneus ventricosus]GBL66962.1 hypothetical protein AVEN_262010-1 [Araneus ventricosus]
MNAIESAVIVVISDLLTVCVAKFESAQLLLPMNCCLFTFLSRAKFIVSCYPCYMFSYIFAKKTIILHYPAYWTTIHPQNDFCYTGVRSGAVVYDEYEISDEDGRESRSIYYGSAAEALQGIPAEKLTDLTTTEEAIEARIRDSHLTQFYRTELKT